MHQPLMSGFASRYCESLMSSLSKIDEESRGSVGWLKPSIIKIVKLNLPLEEKIYQSSHIGMQVKGDQACQRPEASPDEGIRERIG